MNKLNILIFLTGGLGVELALYLEEQNFITETSSSFNFYLLDSNLADVQRVKQIPPEKKIISSQTLNGFGGKLEKSIEEFSKIKDKLEDLITSSDLCVFIGGLAGGGTARSFIPLAIDLCNAQNKPSLVLTSGLMREQDNPKNEQSFKEQVLKLSSKTLYTIIDTKYIYTKYPQDSSNLTVKLIGKKIAELLISLLVLIYQSGIDLEDIIVRCFAHKGEFHIDNIKSHKTLEECIEKSQNREYFVNKIRNFQNFVLCLSGPVITANQKNQALNNITMLDNCVDPSPKVKILEGRETYRLVQFLAGMNQEAEGVKFEGDLNIDLTDFQEIKESNTCFADKITRGVYLQQQQERINQLSKQGLSYRKIAEILNKEIKEQNFDFTVGKNLIGDLLKNTV